MLYPHCPDDDFDYMSRVSYSSAMGSLMYAMICSHPYLSYVVSVVSKYMPTRNTRWQFNGYSSTCVVLLMFFLILGGQ